MREILYRAKAINRIDDRKYITNYKNGDWVYGLVTGLYDDLFPNLPATMANTEGVCNIDVDYQTIGQYTGFTDKNGKKIFEGDIVKSYNGDIYTVVFTRTQFILQKKKHKTHTWRYVNMYEVIGNIHDNPELLEGEK